MAVAVERSSRSGNDWTDTAGWIDRGCDVCCRTDDGVSFVVEDGLRVSAASVGATSLTGPSNIVKTSDGHWRMYFSELPIPAGEPNPTAAPVPGTVTLTKHSIYSASSDDLET